jgi:hypothetical protein
MMLVLSSQVILGFDCRGTHDHYLKSQFEAPQPGRTDLRIYIRQDVTVSFTAKHPVPFSSPPTTCKVMVQVVEPASTWG